ncbi:MAG: ATP-dependent protease ATPase subunit HslU [Proteobacteria bacterium]|nr:ATP-dependent protease ATPase subunit HslU [Pseudomonadota bacterium]
MPDKSLYSKGNPNFTPREIVSELDRYIVGQHNAKRAVAIALRNRWRRQQVAEELRDEISPKNILMIGPTGVGKTEIARRLARLASAPFVKVEASKFTEVGYVGRDVDAIVRDLMEAAVALVRREAESIVAVRAKDIAEDRVLTQLAEEAQQANAAQREPYELPDPMDDDLTQQKNELRPRLKAGEFDQHYVEIEVSDTHTPMIEVFNMAGMEEFNIKDMFQSLPGFKNRTKNRKVKVPEALEIFTEAEAEKLIDMDTVIEEGRERAEQSGIVFIDEIDKIVGKSRGGGSGGPDVSREGVQRDLLPLVEGSTVNTKYGPVKTDHVLFIAAGAFHISKPADMVPELQGRFPIRVELDSLGENDFIRILKEPKNALTKQYSALMHTEGVQLQFDDSAIAAIAHTAASANRTLENIGARRLHTVMEKLLDDISFRASEMNGETVLINGDLVRDTLAGVLQNEDLSRYIL